MNTYFMFRKYSAESIKRISAERTKKASNIISNGGEPNAGD